MYNKKSIAEFGGHRRKSARILALEEKENEKRKLRASSSKGKSSEGNNSESFQNPQIKHRVSRTQPSTLKRGRKQKKLEDIDFPFLNKNLYQQDGENSKDRSQSIRTDQHIKGPPVIPERRILDFALAVLQRRDTYSIFAHPVDPKEVENYDCIVKEPMDFGTMKTKIQEGKYTSLDQFESDVFLICSNAMLFNSSSTVYYKEARAMQMLAQTVFSSLRNDPSNFVSEFSFTRGRSGRKLSKKSEMKGTPSRTPRQTGLRIGASPLGPRKDDDSTLTKRDDPQFYRPWTSFLNETENLVSTVYNADKTLELDDENVESRYKQSLIWFARGLGPIPTKEAAKKVFKCISQAQPPAQNTQRPFPTLSLAQRTASPNAQSPISSLQNLPGNSNSLLGRNTFLNLNVKASSSFDRNTARDLMPPPKEPISQTRNDHTLGKRPMLDNNVAHNSPFSRSIHEKMLGKMPILDQNIDHNTPNFSILGGSSRENRAYPSDYTSTYLQPNTHPAQSFAPPKEIQPQNGEFWLASHLKVIPVEDRNNPNGKNFMTVDMLAEPDDQTEKQGPELDYPELSANWKSRLRGFVNRGNNFINSLDLFGGPSETTPNRVQSYGRPSVQGLVSPDHWTSLTNTNNYGFDSTQFGQSSSDGFPSKETFATLDMLLTHEYTPLPSYDELGYAPVKPMKKSTDHPRGTLSVNEKVGPIMKDIDHGPNLSLQL